MPDSSLFIWDTTMTGRTCCRRIRTRLWQLGRKAIIHMVTCSCTEDDLASLPHILLTLNQPWDPHNVQFPSGHHEEEEIAMVKSTKFSSFGDQLFQGTLTCWQVAWSQPQNKIYQWHTHSRARKGTFQYLPKTSVQGGASVLHRQQRQ